MKRIVKIVFIAIAFSAGIHAGMKAQLTTLDESFFGNAQEVSSSIGATTPFPSEVPDMFVRPSLFKGMEEEPMVRFRNNGGGEIDYEPPVVTPVSDGLIWLFSVVVAYGLFVGVRNRRRLKEC